MARAFPRLAAVFVRRAYVACASIVRPGGNLRPKYARSMPERKSRSPESLETGSLFSAPGGTRTPDIILRTDAFYPTELPRRLAIIHEPGGACHV